MMKVYLRPFTLDDYKVSVKWRNDRTVTKSLSGNYFFISPEREKKWVENAIFNDRNDIRLAICIAENDRYIGNVGLNSIDWINRNAEFGIFIGETKESGKGYATEATQLLLSHGFKQLMLERIYLNVLKDNEKALHIYGKCGFKQEGVQRHCLFKDNQYHDFILMSILRSEFNELDLNDL